MDSSNIQDGEVGRSAAAALLWSKFPYFNDIPPVIKNVGRRVLTTLGERNRSGLSRAEEQFIRNFYKLSNLQKQQKWILWLLVN